MDTRSIPGKPYRGKRVVDLVILAIVAVPAAILGSACAAAIALNSRGGVFFRQERIGMVAGDNPIFPDASRITSVGKILRRLSLDELPQLINVATGEMSIVGPRPTLGYQVERYDDQQRQRLNVRPGLTGLAQVSGRNSLPWAERIAYDIDYVRTQSVRTDLQLIGRTLKTIVTGDGVEGHPEDDPMAVTEASTS